MEPLMLKPACLILTTFFASALFADFEQIELSKEPKIVLLRDFLSVEECDYLIEISKPHMARSQVLNNQGGEGVIDERRLSEGYFIPVNLEDEMLSAIEERIDELTGYPQINGENLHVLHYGVGGEFKPHFDFFNEDTVGGQEAVACGGQRVITLVMYLNDPKEGGETVFPEVDITIKPKKGNALLFHNLEPGGAVDLLSYHGGSPVKAGEKWIATKWIRQEAYVKYDLEE